MAPFTDYGTERMLIKAAGGLVWRQAAGDLEVAILHRPEQNDWSLPKGKLKAGESWRQAALREVREETQCDVEIGEFIGFSRYTSRGLPKLVLYWHMHLVAEHTFEANREVDQLVWLTSKPALERLYYKSEQRLLQRAYYIARKPELLAGLGAQAQTWKIVLSLHYGEAFAQKTLGQTRQVFEDLLPKVPYIGGRDNHLTDSLLGSAGCLALYKALKAQGCTAADAGKILYDSMMSRVGEPHPGVPPESRLTQPQLMERRRQRARRSQARRYAADWVYEFVPGDGIGFDYGYDFSECATQKFYRAQDADDFLPYYCFLDYAESRRQGLGLERTMTLAEGHPLCNHRFKAGRKTEPGWPPPFVDSSGS